MSILAYGYCPRWMGNVALGITLLAGACQPDTGAQRSTRVGANVDQRTEQALDDSCVPLWTDCRAEGLCGLQFNGCYSVNCGPCTCTEIPCTDLTLSCEYPSVHCWAEGTECCGSGL